MSLKKITRIGRVDGPPPSDKVQRQRYVDFDASGKPVERSSAREHVGPIARKRSRSSARPDYRVENGVFPPTFPYKRIVDALEDFISNPAVAAAGEWQIFLPLADGILPNARLAVFSSPFQCLLRFSSRNPEVTKVLSEHQLVLCERLKAIFPAGTDVIIDF